VNEALGAREPEARPGSRIVILGAGRSMSGGVPTALVAVDGQHRLLDWLLSAFSVLEPREVCFVCGYRASEVEAGYPDIRFYFNPDWADTGPAESLAHVPFSGTQTTFVAYSDVVFRPDAVRRLAGMDEDCVLAVDTRWRTRFERRSREDIAIAEKVRCASDRLLEIGPHIEPAAASGEFAGVMKVGGGAVAVLRRLLQERPFERRAGLPDLVRLMMARGVQPRVVDIRGEWAELNAPQDLARFVLGTKAESLARLKPLVRCSRIDDLVSFSLREWREDRGGVLARVRSVFGAVPGIVRSSAIAEDSWHASGAGAYLSLHEVPLGDAGGLAAAVDQVFASYDAPLAENQVLIQEELARVRLSGVVLTRTHSGAPYRVFNFDDASARTDTVTSGTTQRLRSVYRLRSDPGRGLPRELHPVEQAVAELETLVGHDSLDVEFAVTQDGRVHVLQVRPIAIGRRAPPVADERVSQGLERAARLFRQLSSPSPLLVGRSTQLSVMADWNPAEMIGTKPGVLAFSLYRHLISDEVWATQRAEYGYRDVRPCNLIVDVLGHPYVDVRTDFNSFVPAALPDSLATRLVDHYLERLAHNGALHDKVEFEVVLTCLGFDFETRVRPLREAGFDGDAIALLRRSLLEITRAGIARNDSDLRALSRLQQAAPLREPGALPPLERAYHLLEHARRFGVPLFSHLARSAFVAVDLLRSLCAVGAVSEGGRQRFLASLRSVPSVMQEDAASVAAGTLSWDGFVERYGHLRPGSYDITVPCYASAPDQFLRPLIGPFEGRAAAVGAWDEVERRNVAAELARLDLGVDPDGLESFLRQSIQGREFGKLAFTRSLSAGLESLAEFGATHGVARDELAHIRVGELLALRGAPSGDVRETLLRLSRVGQETFALAQSVCLPGHVLDEQDFFCFEQPASEPNFVSQRRIRAAAVSGPPATLASLDVGGKILLIPSADPGFDWVFARGIAGLVTMYGGVNSHMAIRASELQLPAVIGTGELLFEELSQASLIDLDCAARRVSVVR
jgi:choline kinase/phosphohistidine swiveling domain-containing protein